MASNLEAHQMQQIVAMFNEGIKPGSRVSVEDDDGGEKQSTVDRPAELNGSDVVVWLLDDGDDQHPYLYLTSRVKPIEA